MSSGFTEELNKEQIDALNLNPPLIGVPTENRGI